MPVIFVTGYPRSKDVRAEVSRTLTDAVALLADAPAEKVQVFFREVTPGPDLIEVHAVAHGPDHQGWRAALSDAIGHTYEIRVHLYKADHTARGGVLREPKVH